MTTGDSGLGIGDEAYGDQPDHLAEHCDLKARPAGWSSPATPALAHGGTHSGDLSARAPCDRLPRCETAAVNDAEANDDRADADGSPGPDIRLVEFLADPAHLPMDLATSVHQCAQALGLPDVLVFLADIQQRQLTALNLAAPTQEIDSSVAGASYRTQIPQLEPQRQGITLWQPLVDGVERLGVLSVHVTTADEPTRQRASALAALCAMMITSKRAYKDTFVRRARTHSMDLAAEMLRAFLPPRTIGTPSVTSTAVLEPAYEIGGDAFDHALSEDTLHAAVLDATGHNLASGLTTAVALAACRKARRTEAGLLDLVHEADEALITWLPDLFCTGVLCRLHLPTGMLRWVNCGHPPPLLIRDGRLVEGAFRRRADLPMGTPSKLSRHPRSVHQIQLQPGDRVLVHTDGITEARNADGSELGVEHLAHDVADSGTLSELAPETLRRLIHSFLDATGPRLKDDATILMLEWKPAQTMT
ncbi:PP2C family protein-serine/threonine phosphatase [Streptomyces sp. NPDC051561]|uniref:PP2C family protein-serine/threonine phosphatase n=1 Tax=Streptomyces sp. NPDC051561 TaxID=3365658 RepID=UPI0037ADD868